MATHVDDGDPMFRDTTHPRRETAITYLVAGIVAAVIAAGRAGELAVAWQVGVWWPQLLSVALTVYWAWTWKRLRAEHHRGERIHLLTGPLGSRYTRLLGTGLAALAVAWLVLPALAVHLAASS